MLDLMDVIQYLLIFKQHASTCFIANISRVVNSKRDTDITKTAC